MKVGFVGLGKLGLPVALAMAERGLDVMGHDAHPSRMTIDPKPEVELGMGTKTYKELLQDTMLKFGSLPEVVDHAEVLFCAVQTPHELIYEGTSPLPDTRKDFDYSHLCGAIRAIVRCAGKRDIALAIVSTVLPGTTEREILPILHGTNIDLVYNPSFIAMGQVIPDLLDPEFVLLGGMQPRAILDVEQIYKKVCVSGVKFRRMSIASAELTKVAYNTLISLKIAFANTVGQICAMDPGIGDADADDVMEALKSADQRLTSPAYLTPGMGDGGGCHPRDNIAMSWLARELGLGFDLFEAAMKSREDHALWLAEMWEKVSRIRGIPARMLGTAFKPETDIETGSPALLVLEHFRQIAKRPAEVVRGEVSGRAVYFIGCKKPEYAKIGFPFGSIVLDPFRYIPDQTGVDVRRIGEGERGRWSP